MKAACPLCAQQGKQVLVQETFRYPDQQGFVKARVICNCGFIGEMPVTVETPPCKRCGHSEVQYLKAGGQAAATHGLVAAPTDGTEVMKALRGPGAPAENAF